MAPSHEKNCEAKRPTKDQTPLHESFTMGNSKNRTGLEWVEIGRFLRSLETKIKKTSMVAFLDGSSNLSTKKAGSGAYILGSELEMA